MTRNQIALILSLIFCLIVLTPTVTAASYSTFVAEDEAGYWGHLSEPYLSYVPVWNDTDVSGSGDIMTTSDGWLMVGTVADIIDFPYPYIDEYGVYRGTVSFNTSFVPDDANITSVVLSLFVGAACPATTPMFNITVQNWTGTYPHNPIVSGDYYQVHYSGSVGSRNVTDNCNAGYYWNITLDSDGMTAVNITGLTTYVLRSSVDIDGTDPLTTFDYDDYLQYVGFRTKDYSITTAPLLYLTYDSDLPEATPEPTPTPAGGSSGGSGSSSWQTPIPSITPAPVVDFPFYGKLGIYGIVGVMIVVFFVGIANSGSESKKRSKKRG